MPIRVDMVSLGYSKNLVDSERMLAKLRAHGYQLVTEPGEAEIAIVNTVYLNFTYLCILCIHV